MNAKKIMGAVLVALLAAALFTGAAAATNYGNVFVYGQNDGIPTGTWSYGAATVIVETGGDTYPGANFVAGTYKNGDHTAYFTYPTVSYAATGLVNSVNYIIGDKGKVYNDTALTLVPTPLNNTVSWDVEYLVTYPNGSVIRESGSLFTENLIVKGTYSVQAVFDGNTGFVTGVPFDALLDDNIFSFTVIGDDDATVSSSVNTAYDGEPVTFTIEGTPGKEYKFNVTGLDIAIPQLYPIDEGTSADAFDYSVEVQNNGKVTITAVVNASTIPSTEDKNKAVFEVLKVKNGKLSIKIAAPVVTAVLAKDSYFVGDEIQITGTATSNAELEFYIKGTNFNRTAKLDAKEYVAGKTWEAKIATQDLVDKDGKKLDVGTYTITIKQAGNVVATLPVGLKQPFISLTEAPEVVAQGTAAKFVGTAEAATKVRYYVFGTNYFASAEVSGEDAFDGNTFTFEIAKGVTKEMAAGQYFVVIQHPMYDKNFNILPINQAIYQNTTGQVTNVAEENTFLFNVSDRQTANAAQALCDALDSQNIDDMYVKYAFIIAGQDEAFTINEIPTEVTKGSKIVVSGTATAYANEYVTVEMISTAFAAVPKETVGSASFITLSTKVAEDGTWEVTFDTSDLNVDEYSIKVACDGNTWKSVNVNVIEGAPVTPTEPTVVPTDAPVTPTEAPKTPGFGALAALAGLGAVAVLLLRRE